MAFYLFAEITLFLFTLSGPHITLRNPDGSHVQSVPREVAHREPDTLGSTAHTIISLVLQCVLNAIK